MAPGPLGVGWAGSFGRELGPRMRRVRKPYLLSRGIPFMFFCYLFGFMWCIEGEVGLRELGGSRLSPSPPFFPLLPCLRLRLFHLLGFLLALLFRAHAEAIEVAGCSISVSLS